MQKQLKRAFKYFIIIALINLLYLNVLVPVALSFEQIFIIALGVVAVCYKRGIDIETISPDELDQLIKIPKGAVKRVFKENGFRFLPQLAEPAFAAGELILYRSIYAIEYIVT